MQDIFPQVKPNATFRANLRTQIITEFIVASEKHVHTKFWLTWLIPALSLVALVAILSVPIAKRQQETKSVAQLDQDMTTIEQQLVSDPQLDAAINFKEI